MGRTIRRIRRERERTESEHSPLFKEIEPVIIKIIRESLKPALKEAWKEILSESEHSILKPEQVEPVSTSEIKRRWGKSRTTVIKACKQRGLKHIGKIGRQFLFDKNDIVRLFGLPYDK